MGKVDENALKVVTLVVESLHPEVDLKKPIQKPRVEWSWRQTRVNSAIQSVGSAVLRVMNTGGTTGQISNRILAIDTRSDPVNCGTPSCRAEFEHGLNISVRP